MSTTVKSSLDPHVRIKILCCDTLPWCEQIHAKVKCRKCDVTVVSQAASGFSSLQIQMGGDHTAGRIIAHSISRVSLRSSRESFHWHFADLPYEHAYSIGLELFDRYGRLRRHLYGTFTDETDDGRLLLIEKVTLKASYHHQGIACKAVRILLQHLNDVLAFSTWCALAGKLPCTFYLETPQHFQSCKGCLTTTLLSFMVHVFCNYRCVMPKESDLCLCPVYVVMHPEECEMSWQVAGFRTIKQTGYLACIPYETHLCWDQQEVDPVYIPEAKPPALEPVEQALLNAISAGYLP